MATATTNGTIKGFKVICPNCGDRDATISIDLNLLKVCRCSSCDDEFHPSFAARKLAEEARRWEAVARWVEMAGAALDGAGAESEA